MGIVELRRGVEHGEAGVAEVPDLLHLPLHHGKGGIVELVVAQLHDPVARCGARCDFLGLAEVPRQRLLDQDVLPRFQGREHRVAVRAAVADEDALDVVAREHLPVIGVPGVDAVAAGDLVEQRLVGVRHGGEPEAIVVVLEVGDVAELGDGARADDADPDPPAHGASPRTSTGLPVRALSTTASMARMFATPFSPGSSIGLQARIRSAKYSASRRHW